MAFGASTYLKNGYHAEVAWGWYYNSSNQVEILWNSVVQYQGSIYLYNPYRDFTDGDAFPGNDGNNYAIGDPQTADNVVYTYTTLTYSTNTYSAGYEYYGVRQEVVTPIIPPDTSIIVENNTPLFSSSSFDIRLTATTSSTTYEIRSSSYSGTILKTITNQNNVWVTVNNQPSTSGTTYYITAFVSEANGGDGTRSNVTTFTVTRNSEVTPDTNITVSPSGNFTIPSTATSVTLNVSNAGASTQYRLLKLTDTTTQVAIENGSNTSFALSTTNIPTPGGTALYRIEARVLVEDNGSGNWSTVYDALVSKISEPVNSGTLIPLGITSGAIDLNTLRSFFGNPTYNSSTISMSDLYRGGNLVPDISQNSSVPTSGEIELADLYGAHTQLTIDKNPDVKQFFIPYGQPAGTAVLNWSMSTSPTGQGSVDTGYKALKFVCDYRWVVDVTDTSGNVPNLSVLEWGGVNYASQATSFPYTTPWYSGLTSLNIEYDYGIQTGSVAGTVKLEVRKVWDGLVYSAETGQVFWEVVVENANE